MYALGIVPATSEIKKNPQCSIESREPRAHMIEGFAIEKSAARTKLNAGKCKG